MTRTKVVTVKLEGVALEAAAALAQTLAYPCSTSAMLRELIWRGLRHAVYEKQLAPVWRNRLAMAHRLRPYTSRKNRLAKAAAAVPAKRKGARQ